MYYSQQQYFVAILYRTYGTFAKVFVTTVGRAIAMLRALVNESVLLLSFFAYAFASTISDKCFFNFGPWRSIAHTELRYIPFPFSFNSHTHCATEIRGERVEHTPSPSTYSTVHSRRSPPLPPFSLYLPTEDPTSSSLETRPLASTFSAVFSFSSSLITNAAAAAK